jgi:hypothetical protein
VTLAGSDMQESFVHDSNTSSVPPHAAVRPGLGWFSALTGRGQPLITSTAGSDVTPESGSSRRTR